MSKKIISIIAFFSIFAVSAGLESRQKYSRKKKGTIRISKRIKNKNRYKDRSKGEFLFHIVEKGYILVPTGNLKKLLNTGFGASFGFGLDYNSWILGTEGGYWRFSGKDNNTESLVMTPFFLSIGYKFKKFDKFYILPQFSSGFTINTLKYNNNAYLSNLSDPNYISMVNVESISKTMLKVGYTGSMFHAGLGVGYSAFIQKSGLQRIITMNINVGVRW